MTTEAPSAPDTAALPPSAGRIRNPVLPGFHPDPSILRVGEDYYLATSTFEWYPGVTLHHSRDLVHWRPLPGALSERRLLDLTGVPDSGGVWAPCLSHAHGRFHLVFTRVDSHHGGWWDAQNYVTTASDIEGPWSDPVPVHARGFDPSLFHDADGSCWMLCMTGDWRSGHNPFGGIQAQRWDCAEGRLAGEVHMIFQGTEAQVTEGPHLYRRDGFYYLMTAEGGTSWDHQVTVARSRGLLGPYTPDPAGPTLTARGRQDLTLQKAGHGSLAATPADEWYLAHLVGRPAGPDRRCVLGRETALQRVEWSADGWPRVAGGVPAVEVPGPALPAAPVPAGPERDEFTAPRLDPRWATLRRPATADWLDVGAGRLRIAGGQSPRGLRAPSLLARRVTARRCELSASIDFDPAGFPQLAGVTGYYDSRNWHYAYLTRADSGARELRVLSCDDGRRVEHREAAVPLPERGPVDLRVLIDAEELRFGYRLPAEEAWHDLGVGCDATILSDEYAGEKEPPEGRAASPAFTGAFLGLWVWDMAGEGTWAEIGHATFHAG